MMLLLLLLACQATPEDLAKKIGDSVRADGAWLDQNFDLDLLFARSFKSEPGDPKRKDGFGRGIKKTFNLGKQTAQSVKDGGSYTLLRIRTGDGKTRVLFRVLIGESFNYHEYLLEPAPGGGFRIVDLYPYISGEWLSDTFRRAYLKMLASDPAGGTLKDNEYMKNLDKINRMSAARDEGRPADVLKLFASLPPALQKDKSLLLMRCIAASDVGEKESLEAVEAMKKQHPGDPCLAIHSLAPYTAAKRFDAALEAVDAIEKATGGDAWLQVQRLEIHMAAGAPDKARAAGLKAIETEKTLETAWWSLVSIELREKKYAEAAQWLGRIEKELKIEVADLTKIEAYAGFVKSPEYAAWMKSRGR